MTTQTKTYTYDYNRVWLTIYKKDSSIGNALVAFLQDEQAHELADELAKATEQQRQEILSQYDY